MIVIKVIWTMLSVVLDEMMKLSSELVSLELFEDQITLTSQNYR